jgi:hypothetical protein
MNQIRITRTHPTTGGRFEWTGTLLSTGTMTCGGSPMEWINVRLSDGAQQCFAVDPWFSTEVVELSVRPAGDLS